MKRSILAPVQRPEWVFRVAPGEGVIRVPSVNPSAMAGDEVRLCCNEVHGAFGVVVSVHHDSVLIAVKPIPR